ncbi:hypothetical protein KTC92_10485 [Clostridium sp. CM027]|uniref:hypothetical protein n=1 Tax=Clostridium sp. CM027 TaxID=2849865 RepID=UPI001C6F1FA1|nr:hypothetical protein [Clostridium sp. CM027]MBW9147021.1 hypothetical protein [Clostridium sp. CM027]UVE39668.1 hypothetical protein KTC92_10485 [Clostridium sp. CM027]
MFLPFYQCDDSRSKKASTGVGLEILVLNNCILEEVDSEVLKSPEFEEKIMEILKEGGND